MGDPFLVGQVAVADPIIVGLVVGIPTTVLGVLGYRRSVKLDRQAAASAGVMARSTETQQIIDGLGAMVERLQADNETLRAENTALKASR